MIWNDLIGEHEEEKSSFIQDEELEGAISSLLNLRIPSLMMMTDSDLKHPMLALGVCDWFEEWLIP